jgi:hypothetical protein
MAADAVLFGAIGHQNTIMILQQPWDQNKDYNKKKGVANVWVPPLPSPL